MDNPQFNSNFSREYRNTIKFAENRSELREEMTVEELESLQKREIAQTSPIYKKAMFEYTKIFTLRIFPFPASFMRSVRKSERFVGVADRM